MSPVKRELTNGIIMESTAITIRITVRDTVLLALQDDWTLNVKHTKKLIKDLSALVNNTDIVLGAKKILDKYFICYTSTCGEE